ncbi:unnamed protein product, partial [Protopolystoma xenopodis]
MRNTSLGGTLCTNFPTRIIITRGINGPARPYTPFPSCGSSNIALLMARRNTSSSCRRRRRAYVRHRYSPDEVKFDHLIGLRGQARGTPADPNRTRRQIRRLGSRGGQSGTFRASRPLEGLVACLPPGHGAISIHSKSRTTGALNHFGRGCLPSDRILACGSSILSCPRFDPSIASTT